MLTEVFGDYPQVRVLEVLIANPTMEFTKSDLAMRAKISRATLYRFWDNIERHKVVKVSRRIANSQLFILNMESPLVEGLTKFPSTGTTKTQKPVTRTKKQTHVLASPTVALPVAEKLEKEVPESGEKEFTDVEKQTSEIREFLRSLDEYYAAGTLSESAYRELREKNLKKLENKV